MKRGSVICVTMLCDNADENYWPSVPFAIARMIAHKNEKIMLRA